MRKFLLALGLVLLVFAVVTPANAQLSPTTGQTPISSLAVYAYPLSSLMDACGPESTGIFWDWRQAIISAFNVLFAPVLEWGYHPLLDANVGSFCSLYHEVRMNKALDTFVNGPRPGPGEIRITQLYSSGYFLETTTMRAVVDLAVETFNPTPLNNAYMTPITPAFLATVAQYADISFITHAHIDHMSPYFAQEMAMLGKPVVVTQEIRDAVVNEGYSWANALVVPQNGVTYSLPSQNPIPGVSPETLTYTAHQGMQYMGWLNAQGTIPDLSNPYNVQCNCYIINFSNANQTTDITVAHYGDNNDASIALTQQTWAANGIVPNVILSLGQTAPALMQYAAPQVNVKSCHNLEMHHFLNHGLVLLPTQASMNPLALVLTWGESYTRLIN